MTDLGFDALHGSSRLYLWVGLALVVLAVLTHLLFVSPAVASDVACGSSSADDSSSASSATC